VTSAAQTGSTGNAIVLRNTGISYTYCMLCEHFTSSSALVSTRRTEDRSIWRAYIKIEYYDDFKRARPNRTQEVDSKRGARYSTAMVRTAF
jgi:hypothetical protein